MTETDPILIIDAYAYGIVAVSFAISAGITRFLATFMQRAGRLDIPNERSSHTQPTPTGGGIAIILTIGLGSVAWILLDRSLAHQFVWPIGLALALALVSWIDDVFDLHPSLRILAQATALGAMFIWSQVPLPGFAVALLGASVSGLLIFLAWIWFINLYNFMDGIDGLSGVETISICTGIMLVNAVIGKTDPAVLLILIIGAASAGFLIWNWYPARIFMGDVGSVPLGLLLGWLLLRLAEDGQWASALILPAYYLADATLTLIQRSLHREKVWQAHKTHFYQRAHQAGLSHAQVSSRIGATNIVLIALAVVAAMGYPWSALGGAALVVGILLYHLGSYVRKTA